MANKNDNLLVIGALAAVAYFLLKPKNATATSFDNTGFDDNASLDTTPVKIRNFTPGYSSPDIVLDTQGSPNKVLQKIQQAKELLETVSDAQVSIKTPRGTLNIFKGKKRKKKPAKGSVSAEVNPEDIPELLDSAGIDAKGQVNAEAKKRGKGLRLRKNKKSAVVTTANRVAKNVKNKKVKRKAASTVKRPAKAKSRTKVRKPKVRSLKVKHLK